MKMLKFLAIVLYVVLLGCSDSKDDGLVLQLNWTDDPTFTGEYIAKDRFWFLKKLHVDIKQGGIGVDPISMILSKKADFAVVGADKALVAISDGKPIKIVSVDFQRNPVGWIARQELKILRFDDLKGRKDVILGDKAGTETSAILKLILKRKSLSIKPKSVSFDFSYFLANKKCVYPVYLNEEPVKAELIHNLKIVEIDPSREENGGIKMYGNVVIAHSDMVRDRPLVVKNFVSSLNKGWQYAKDNPKEALKIVLRYVKSDEDYVKGVMMRSIDFATNMYGRGVPPGHMEYTAWDETVRLLREGGVLRKEVNINEAVYLWEK